MIIANCWTIDDNGLLLEKVDDKIDRAAVSSESISNVLFLNYNWSLEDHLLLAHTGFNHLRNSEVNRVQNGLSAAANLTTPPDVMDGCAAVLDALSDSDLWHSRRFDPQAIIDRSTGSTATFHSENSSFPEAQCAATLGRCIAAAKGAGCDTYVAVSRHSLSVSQDSRQGSAFRPIATRMQFSYHSMRHRSNQRAQEIRQFAENAFVSHKSGVVSKETVSSWVTDLLPFCYRHGLSATPAVSQQAPVHIPRQLTTDSGIKPYLTDIEEEEAIDD
jgi:hypothetical protein